VAAKLLQQWKFPDKVIYQVFYHHAPWYDKSYSTGSILIYLANQFTKLAGYPCLTSEGQNALTQLQNSKVWNFLGKSGFDLEAEGIEKLTLQIREYISLEADNMLNFFDAPSA
jgi:HD-like signal output (HDOD) protein